MGVGPGGGVSAGSGGGGGGYGGPGGGANSGAASPGGPSYGSLLQPADLGSSGATFQGTLSGPGGGALRLIVSGTLGLEGVISANGGAPRDHSGAGSGGSLWVTTATLTGGGTFEANGANYANYAGGGGGGGRIAVYYQNGTGYENYAGASAAGGQGYQNGTAGSVLFIDQSLPNSHLWAVGGTEVFSPSNSLHYGQVTLTGGASLTIGSFSSFLVDGDLAVTNSSTLAVGGATTLTVGGNLLLRSNSTTWCLSANNTDLVSNRWAGVGATITADNVSVDNTSKITADGQGYVGTTGTPGVGPGGGVSVGSGGGGGGYGGPGGDGINGAASPGGPVYGSLLQPADLGSSGATFQGALSGPGGGAIRLIVSGTLGLEGVISANGGAPRDHSGAGSGGSLWVTTATLTGGGTFEANGASFANYAGGGGGGGRIAVYYHNGAGYTNYAGASSAGGEGWQNGSPGSVVFVDTSVPNQGLWLSGNDVFAGSNQWHFGTVTLAGGTVSVGGGSTFTVDGALMVTNGSTLVCEATNTTSEVNGQWAGVGVGITAASVFVDAGSQITADSQGYGTGDGPGAGVSGSWASGAGYGGVGGASGNGLPGGPTYGSALAPVDLGSGGATGDSGWGWCPGGGAIEFDIAGPFTINGTVSANGAPSPTWNCSGGSGGSLLVRAGLLAGSGSLAVNGGAARGAAGGGGAGRIAIYTYNNSFTGTYSELGGSPYGYGAQPGAPGTLESAIGPAITRQPMPATVYIGVSNAPMTVVASGSGTLVYQWLHGGVALAGETNASLVLPNPQPADAGNYYVTLSDNTGLWVTSGTASLTVLSCEAPSAGLVGFWAADGNTADLLGQDDGTISGNVSFAAGLAGQAFQFDGDGSVVSIPNSPSLNFNGSNPMSVSLWINRSASGTGTMHLLGMSSGCSNDIQYQLVLDGSTVSVGAQPGTGASVAWVVPANTWVHLAATFDGNEFRLFTNGVLAASGSGPLGPPTGAPLEIGGSGSCPTFAGLIDEVTLYNRAISPAEVAGLLAANSAGLCKGLQILAQPQNQVAPFQGQATFSVTAMSRGALDYAWYGRGALLQSGPAWNLVRTNLHLADSGAYLVVVSDSLGNSVTSQVATLTVQPATPVVTWAPPSAIVYGTPLGTSQLNAQASVPGAFSYTPAAGSVPNAGANTLTAVFIPTDALDYASVTNQVTLDVSPAPLSVTANNASRSFGQANPPLSGTVLGVLNGDAITASYTCTATPDSPPGVYAIVPSLLDPNNRLGNYSVSLTNGQLTVGAAPPPTITGISPTFGPTGGGTSVTLSGTAFEAGASVFFGATPSPSVSVSSTTSLTAVTPPGTNGVVSVQLLNPDGRRVTIAGAFTYAVPPSLQTQPTGQTVTVGSKATFAVTATGTPPLYYQWQLSGLNLTDVGNTWGSTSPTLTITNALSANAGDYRLVVSNAYGWAASTVAELVVAKLIPAVVWPAPGGINYGTSLDTNQLNATSTTAGTFSYAPAAGTIPNAGNVLLTATFTPTDTNHYASVTTNAPLVVARMPLLVAANNAARTFGQGNPIFQGSVTGLVNHDNIGATYACSAVPASPPGTYAIAPSLVDPGNRAGNYNLTTQNGTLTVSAGSGPSLAAIAPQAGPTNGGTTVVLLGSGFEVGATVTFAGVPASSVVVSGPNSLSATTPAAPSGPATVAVQNPDGTSVSSAAGFEFGVAPTIQSQPTNQSLVLGGVARFQVQASGDAPLSYQWQLNGVDLVDGPRIAGSRTNALTVQNLTAADAGNYRVFVQNTFATVQSAAAALQVTLPPAITTQPQSAASGAGGSATFTVSASGTSPLNYLWYHNGVPLNVVAGAVLNLTGLQAADQGAYTVVISNPAGSVTSAPAQLSLLTYCAGVSIGQAAYPPGGTIPMSVNTYGCTSGSPVANSGAVVWIYRSGAARQIPVTTDPNGHAVANFTPLPGEAGTFQFGVALPGQPAPPATGSLTVLGLSVGPAIITSRVVVGFPQTYTVTLTNLSLVGLSGINATAVGLPPNVKVHFISWPSVLSGANTATATFQVSATDASYTQGQFSVQFTSTEGASAAVTVNTTITQLLPQLVAEPSSLIGSMLGGSQTFISLEVVNQGATDSGPLQVLIPSSPWLSLVTTQTLASLPPGQSNLVTLALTPALSLPLGAYAGEVTVAGSNTQVVVPFNFNCVSELRGGLLVTVQDQLDLLNTNAPNVSNATVIVTDFLTGTNVATAVTDDSGMVLFTNLLSAYYTVSVSAPEHGSFQTTLLLAADQVNNLTAFLALDLVSYTWTVVPTQIQDEYDFTLTAT